MKDMIPCYQTFTYERLGFAKLPQEEKSLETKGSSQKTYSFEAQPPHNGPKRTSAIVGIGGWDPFMKALSHIDFGF